MPFSEIYSTPLVALSIATAIITSFAVFGIAERSLFSSPKTYKTGWVLLGALSMGIGIWAMHFIGMLALELPIAVFYDVGITAISIIPAIFASAIILWMMSKNSHTYKQLLINGVLLGFGIGLMHHFGMMAMRMDAVMVHNKGISFLSVLFAVTAATIALKIQVDAADSDRDKFISKRKVISATIMGFAISGMHYTAMAGADFIPKENTGALQGIDSSGLAVMVSAVVLLITITSIFTPLLLRYKQATKELALLVSKEKKTVELLHLANRAAQQGLFEVNFKAGTMQASSDYSLMLGYEPSEFISSFEEFLRDIHHDDIELVQAQFQKAMEEGGLIKVEYRRKTKDGRWLWIYTTGQVVERDNSQKPLKLAGIHANITERKKAEQLDQARNVILEKIVKAESLPDTLDSIVRLIESEAPSSLCSILLLDDKGEHLLTGAAPNLPTFYNEAIHGTSIGDGVGSCGTAAFKKERVIVNDIQTHAYWALYKELAAEAGLASCWSEPILGTGNYLLGTFAIYHPTPQTPSDSSLKLIEFAAQLAALTINHHQSKKKLELSARVFSDTHEGILITEPDGTIIEVNPAFCGITGHSHEEVIGQNPKILSSGKQGPQFYYEMWQSLAEKGHWQGEIWNRKKNGTLYAELLNISAINDDKDNTLNYVGIFSDITYAKKQQKELELMAHYDVLTKLPNRALFYDRFLQAVAHSKRTETLLAVCFLDLDNFKPVNDTFGHNIGDELLIEVAERIKRNIREEDTVSRQGGDEFTLLLGELDSFAPCEKMLKRMLTALSKPYFIEGETITISASLGVTLYPQDNSDIDTLTRHADQSMYQAKLAGKNRYHLFNPEVDQQVSLKHQQRGEIQHALSNNEFVLYYQPKVNLKSGEIYGAEALIRWLHPEKGLIPPLNFLPVIEETLLEIQIGEWVIEQALAQIARWKKEGISLEISVNIASYHLQSGSFVSQLEQALSKQPMVNPSNLQLEILESSALGDTQVITAIIKSCQEALGVKVALDDFGTGYSSLTHLRNLPAETIKIDQSFVRDMLDDPSDYTIIDGIIGLANSFGRNVIAEGVESEEHGLMLLMMGCNYAQGYGIARPMPAGQFSDWLSSYRPNAAWVRSASTEHTQKSRLIQTLRIAVNQWAKRLELSLQSPPEKLYGWPIMEIEKCFFGAWVRQGKHEKLFELSWLDELEQIHHKMHTLAKEFKKAHEDGQPEAVIEGLPAIKMELEEIEKLLKRGEVAPHYLATAR